MPRVRKNEDLSSLAISFDAVVTSSSTDTTLPMLKTGALSSGHFPFFTCCRDVWLELILEYWNCCSWRRERQIKVKFLRKWAKMYNSEHRVVVSNSVLHRDSLEQNYQYTPQIRGNPNEFRKRYCPSQHWNTFSAKKTDSDELTLYDYIYSFF